MDHKYCIEYDGINGAEFFGRYAKMLRSLNIDEEA